MPPAEGGPTGAGPTGIQHFVWGGAQLIGVGQGLLKVSGTVVWLADASDASDAGSLFDSYTSVKSVSVVELLVGCTQKHARRTETCHG